jgi:hypothetical protein
VPRKIWQPWFSVDEMPREFCLLRIFCYVCATKAGADVMILKIFAPNTLANNIGVFTKTTTSSFKNMIITLVFEKDAKS